MKIYKIHYKNNYFTISNFGANILECMINNKPILFLSKKAKLDKTKPIRGGIPIIFPVFGNSSNVKLPKHGFARTSMWKYISQWENNNNSGIIFQLDSDEITKKMWNYDFTLNLSVTLDKNKLLTNLTLTNNSKKIMTADLLYHTYYRINNIHSLKVYGFRKKKYYNQLSKKTRVNNLMYSVIREEIDQVYNPINNYIRFDNINIKCWNTLYCANNYVFWNPWINKSKILSDFDDKEYKSMICIEPGIINNTDLKSNNITLNPNQQISFSQQISVSI